MGFLDDLRQALSEHHKQQEESRKAALATLGEHLTKIERAVSSAASLVYPYSETVNFPGAGSQFVRPTDRPPAIVLFPLNSGDLTDLEVQVGPYTYTFAAGSTTPKMIPIYASGDSVRLTATAAIAVFVKSVSKDQALLYK